MLVSLRTCLPAAARLVPRKDTSVAARRRADVEVELNPGLESKPAARLRGYKHRLTSTDELLNLQGMSPGNIRLIQ